MLSGKRRKVRTREQDLSWSLAFFAIGAGALVFASYVEHGTPAFLGVILGLYPSVFGGLGLIVSAGRYFGLVADRLSPEEQHAFVKRYIDDLLKSIGGGAIPTVKSDVLKRLHRQNNYPAMLGWIKNSMRLELRVGLRIVDSFEARGPMWIEVPKPVPPIGSSAFKNTRVIINATRNVLYAKPFDWVVAGFAHELSHVVLFSIGHKLQEDEKAVDLAAMILGYENFMVNAKETKADEIGWFGYLTIPEREFARSYFKKVRRER